MAVNFTHYANTSAMDPICQDGMVLLTSQYLTILLRNQKVITFQVVSLPNLIGAAV